MPGFTIRESIATGHLEKLKNTLAAGVRRLEPEIRMKTDITRKDCEALLKHLASQFNPGLSLLRTLLSDTVTFVSVDPMFLGLTQPLRRLPSPKVRAPLHKGKNIKKWTVNMVQDVIRGSTATPSTLTLVSNPVPDNVLTIRPGLLTLPGNTNVTNNLPEIENPETLDISDADHNAIPPINNQEPPVPRWYPRPTSDGGIYVLSTIQQLMEPPRRQVPVLGVMRYPEAAQKTLQSFTWTTEVKSVILEESTLAPNGMRGYPPDTDTSEVARLPQPPIANRFPPKREDLGWKDKEKSVMAARARVPDQSL
ncbi:hypothetical protein CDV55_107690 [Aspergillus turcosus]|nr:hypothetical protein CDV55_107690 [Aspergillus turcosus]